MDYAESMPLQTNQNSLSNFSNTNPMKPAQPVFRSSLQMAFALFASSIYEQNWYWGIFRFHTNNNCTVFKPYGLFISLPNLNAFFSRCCSDSLPMTWTRRHNDIQREILFLFRGFRFDDEFFLSLIFAFRWKNVDSVHCPYGCVRLLILDVYGIKTD